MKIKFKPSFVFSLTLIFGAACIGKWELLAHQFYPSDLWILIIPFLFLTLMNVTAKKYQEADDLKQQLDMRARKNKLGAVPDKLS